MKSNLNFKNILKYILPFVFILNFMIVFYYLHFFNNESGFIIYIIIFFFRALIILFLLLYLYKTKWISKENNKKNMIINELLYFFIIIGEVIMKCNINNRDLFESCCPFWVKKYYNWLSYYNIIEIVLFISTLYFLNIYLLIKLVTMLDFILCLTFIYINIILKFFLLLKYYTIDNIAKNIKNYPLNLENSNQNEWYNKIIIFIYFSVFRNPKFIKFIYLLLFLNLSLLFIDFWHVYLYPGTLSPITYLIHHYHIYMYGYDNCLVTVSSIEEYWEWVELGEKLQQENLDEKFNFVIEKIKNILN
jgi:hypothetical protein